MNLPTEFLFVETIYFMQSEQVLCSQVPLIKPYIVRGISATNESYCEDKMISGKESTVFIKFNIILYFAHFIEETLYAFSYCIT